MDESAEVSQSEIGRYLMQLRERAGIKQAELARRITWSPTLVSRVESGDRALAPEEFQQFVAALGTPEALGLQEVLQREWSVLPRPALDHPDQDLLWDAEQVAKDLVALREQPDVRNAFERRLATFVDEIQRTAKLLLKRDHQVAFIGSIGIGKSTAICRVTGLTVPGPDGGQPLPVLEVGAGGITVCEVHLRTGPQYGLIIEPCSDDEIRAVVTEFAEHLRRGDSASSEDPGARGDVQGISKELERAIRNMAGLRKHRGEKVAGKVSRRDDARDLAQSQPGLRELVVEVLARMELHKRDRRDIWYDAAVGKPPLVWLKETFEQVNNGRHPEFTLPRRIEVVVPIPLLGETDLAVRILDTKGIDRTAARADLEMHLDDPHTVAVLCTGFNNAPAAESRLLLERAREAGVRSLETHAALLVLPHPGEALAVKDESGVRVEDVAEGYDLKREQIDLALEPLGLALPIGFFNAHQDAPETLRTFLSERIARSRQTFRDRMTGILVNARHLLANYEQEQVQEVLRHATTMLRTWAEEHARPLTPASRVQDSLLDQIKQAYPSTIRATVRREGTWPNLNYEHHLGFGARRMATQSLSKHIEGFSELCKTMVANPDYAEAKDLVVQADRVLATAYEDLLRKIQLMGQTSFHGELNTAAQLWSQCMAEWGSGPGYRERVAAYTGKWFAEPSQQRPKDELSRMIHREWTQALARMTELLDGDQDELEESELE